MLQDGLGNFLNEYARSSLSNSRTGVGTARDSSAATEINSALALSIIELQSLYRSSQVVENIICKLPNSSLSVFTGWDITGNSQTDTSFSLEFFDWLTQYNFWDALKDAMYSSRLYGDGFVLLDLDDGTETDKPINLERIKGFRYSLTKGQDECFPADSWQNTQLYSVVHQTEQNQKEQPNKMGLRYHKSRLLKFTGKRLFGSMLRNNAGKNDSVINQLFSAYSNWETSHNDIKNLLGSHSLFTIGIQGLARKARSEGNLNLFTRFETMMMSMNIMKGIPFDKDTETVDFISRSFAGVKEAYEVLQTQLLSACNLPSYIVFGQTTGTAFSESGNSERLLYEQAVEDYITHEVKPALSKLFNICRFIPNSPAYGLTLGTPLFKSTLVLSELEQAELYEKTSRADVTLLTSGVLTPQIIADSRFGGHESYGVNIQLPENYKVPESAKITEERTAPIKKGDPTLL